MRYTIACLKRAPWVAFPLLIIAGFGHGVMAGGSDKVIAGCVVIVVGMLVFGLVADLIAFMVRLLARAIRGPAASSTACREPEIRYTRIEPGR